MAEQLDKIPPQCLEAEQAVLGAMILDEDGLLQAIEKLKPADFYRVAHRKIFKAMYDMFHDSVKIDLLTLAHELQSREWIEDIGGRAYLAGLTEATPSIANIEHHMNIVTDKSVLNKLIEICNACLSYVYDVTKNPTEILDNVEAGIFEIKQDSLQGKIVAVPDILQTVFESFEKMGQGEITGVPSGWLPIDQLTTGFQDGDMITVACRPSVGKTAFSLNAAEYMAVEKKLSVLIFQLEMTKEQLVQRLLCTRARVSSHKLRSGRLDDKDWTNLSLAVGPLAEAKIFIDDSASMDCMAMRAKARRHMAHHGLDFVIIDYLQLITPPKGLETRNLEVGYISRSIKAMAKELNVPVMALSQLSRQVENRGKDAKPILSDLRESGNIEQDSDVVIFIHRPREDGELLPEAEVLIAKQRNGPTGKIDLNFVKDIARFELPDTYHQRDFYEPTDNVYRGD